MTIQKRKSTKLYWFNILTIVFLVLFSCSTKYKGSSNDESKLPPLRISSNKWFLITDSGSPVFLTTGTAWHIHYKLDTTEVNYYFNKRKEQKFNSVAICGFRARKGGFANVYGSEPFERSDDPLLYDPTPDLSLLVRWK